MALDELPADGRESTLAALRLRRPKLVRDFIPAEAGAAGVRARMNGGDRTERVARLATSVTIPGAASLLGLSNREVSRLLRGGELRATRRGRHLHTERAAIDAYRHRS